MSVGSDEPAPFAESTGDSPGLDAKDLAALFGVSIARVHEWGRRGVVCREKQGAKRRWLYQVLEHCGKGTPMNALRDLADAVHGPFGAIYARVSSQSESGKLQEQVKALQRKYPEHRVFTDTGSGLDHKRKGFDRMLQLCLKGDIKEICVTTSDRLSHSSYDLLARLLKGTGVHIQVEQKGNSFTEDELRNDMMVVQNGIYKSFQTVLKRNRRTTDKIKPSPAPPACGGD